MNILLVDDDRATLDSVSTFINNLGHKVTCAGNGREGLDLFRKDTYHIVLTDIQMPDMDGFDLLREIKKTTTELVDIIIITGNSDVSTAITALREGAYDYLEKPINIEELAIVIERVSEHLSLKMTNEELTNRFEESVQERVSETESKLENMYRAFRENIGMNKVSLHSKKIGEIFELADIFHKSPTVSVLIEGETGTGKEVVAQFIHYGNEMVPKPFIAINCGAIPADLFESELFGHEAGSFTGSGTTAKKGKLEVAEGGTILLDEIGEMPIGLQVKLLRVLEEREFYRVGGVKRFKFSARIVASTNKSLAEEIKKGNFRSDLYHRLNVGYVKIPPLRERVEEIVPLAYDFMKTACVRHGKKRYKGISPAGEKYLQQLPWPGNIRQLENAVERVVLLYDGPFIEPEHLLFLEDRPSQSSEGPEGNRMLINQDTRFLFSRDGIDLDEFINKLIFEAMEMSGNNKTLAAKLLNISPRTISRRLEKLES